LGGAARDKDLIAGNGGNDVIRGLKDRMAGGRGRDKLVGGKGRDKQTQ
jgi:Ca2+-binding RTX toxin-like protein